MKLGDTIACIYEEDADWYFGKIVEIDKEGEEVKVEFFQPKGPEGLLTGFKFPSRPDSAWVTFQNVLKIAETLNQTTNRAARMYKPSNSEFNAIELLFNQYMSDA